MDRARNSKLILHMSTKRKAKKTAKKAAKKSAKAIHTPAKKPKEAPPMSVPGDVHWNELQTTDATAAKAFYTALFGWKTEAFGGGMDYTILMNEGKGFGGIMQAPKPGMPAMWVNYVVVKNVDATVARITKLGGKVCVPPFDVPGVGRLAIVQDPQGAVFGIHAPKM